MQRYPNGSSLRSNEAYQEMIPYESYFQRFGLLPFDGITSGVQVLAKERISKIYEGLDCTKKRELLGVVAKFFVCTTHFFEETNWPTSSKDPWVPITRIDAMHAALMSLSIQRNKARAIEAAKILSQLSSTNMACPDTGTM